MSTTRKPPVGSLLKSHMHGLAADSAADFVDTLHRKGMGNTGPTLPQEEEVPKVKTSIHFNDDLYTKLNMYRVKTRKKLSDVVNDAVREFLERREAEQDQ